MIDSLNSRRSKTSLHNSCSATRLKQKDPEDPSWMAGSILAIHTNGTYTCILITFQIRRFPIAMSFTQAEGPNLIPRSENLRFESLCLGIWQLVTLFMVVLSWSWPCQLWNAGLEGVEGTGRDTRRSFLSCCLIMKAQKLDPTVQSVRVDQRNGEDGH